MAQTNRLKIEIYGYIGRAYDWYTGEVIANDFDSIRKEIKEFKGKKIDVYINSEGGSVLDAEAIHSCLVGHKAFVTSHIVGFAISSATIITLAADKVIMAENAWFMIHNPTNGAHGDVNDMRKNTNLLEAFTEKLAKLYADKTGESIGTVRDWMDEEKWFTADEAIEAGLVDETRKGINIAASVRVGANNTFINAPEAVKKLLIKNNAKMTFTEFKNWVKNTLNFTVSEKAQTLEDAQAEVKAHVEKTKDTGGGVSLERITAALKKFDGQVTAKIDEATKGLTTKVEAVQTENKALKDELVAIKAAGAGGETPGEEAGGAAGDSTGKVEVENKGGNTIVKAQWFDEI